MGWVRLRCRRNHREAEWQVTSENSRIPAAKLMLARIKHFGLQSRDSPRAEKIRAEKTQTKKLHGMFHSDEFPEAQSSEATGGPRKVSQNTKPRYW